MSRLVVKQLVVGLFGIGGGDWSVRSLTIIKENGKERSITEVMPKFQGLKSRHLPTIQTYTFSNVPANLLTNRSSWKATVDNGSFTTLGHLVAKIGITITGAPAQLAPVPLWFKRWNLID